MQSFAYFAKLIRFLENTRPVLNAADVARATAFNLVQAAEAV